jgi:hypothetical protein
MCTNWFVPLVVPVLLAGCFLETLARADVMGYAVTDVSVAQSAFGTLDLTTGAFDLTALEPGFLPDVALSSNGTLYGLDTIFSSPLATSIIATDFVTINTSTGAMTSLGPLSDSSMETLAFSPSGTLFGYSYSGTLYSIDPSDGDLTSIGTIPAADQSLSDMRFLGDTLYSTNYETGQLLTIDTSNGNVTVIGATGLPPCDAIGGVVGGDLVGIEGVCEVNTSVFSLDPNTLEVTLGASTNTGDAYSFALVGSDLGLQGGTPSSPVFLVGPSVGEVTGTISGEGAEDYYAFYWGGGAFSATTSVTGASGGASYLFSEGVAGTCNNSSATLNGGDGFTGTISVPSLAPGEYCIGIDANSPNDPAFSLTFNTPVSGVPEPSAFVLLSLGLGTVGVLRLKARWR